MNAFNKRPSTRFLLNQTPFDGCLLLFNVNEQQVRQRASEIGMFRVSKVSNNVVTRANRGEISDMYVTLNEES